MSTYPHIGDAIKRYMKRHGLKYTKIAEKIHKRMGYKHPGSAADFMRHVREGALYGTFSNDGWRNEKALPRLEMFLEELELEKQHVIVNAIREVTDHPWHVVCGRKLVYPPPKDLTLEKRVG